MDNKYQVPYIEKQENNDSIYAELKNFEFKVERLKKAEVININSLKDSALFIIKGKIKLVISNDLGAEKVVFYFHEKTFCGSYLPELVDVMSIMLIVEEECEVAYLPGYEFMQYMTSNQSKYQELIAGMGKRFAIIYSNMLDMQSETSKNRIYNLIYQMALNNIKEIERENILINNFPSTRDMSLITGVHTRNIYKYIADLENMNIIEKVKSGIVVKNIGKLEILIKEGHKS